MGKLPLPDQRRAWSKHSWYTFFKTQEKLACKLITKVIAESWKCDPSEWSNSKAVVALACPFQCQCTLAFSTKHGLALHMFKVHGYKRPVRWWVDTAHCPACMREFWTRARVQEHISKSPSCVSRLSLRAVISEKEAEGLGAAQKLVYQKCKANGRHKSWAELPWIQLQGPLPEFDSDEERVLFLPEQPPVQCVAEHEAQRDAGVDLQLHLGVDPSEGCDIDVPSEAG